jgi:hypothetical protein
MRVTFRNPRLSSANKERLAIINGIIREYQAQGLVLTLRQLYYQLVSRDVIPNKLSEYAKLSTLLKEGRMAGIVDWEAIEDRLRVPYTPASWDSPADIMDTVINQYKKPRMAGQDNYLEVWVEKDALSGVLKRVTSKYHVPILVNRGYSSASAMFDSYNRFRTALQAGQAVTVLYLGDYDPSGVDMIRDIYDRPLEMLVAMAEEFMQEAWEHFFNTEWLGSALDAKDDLYNEYYEDESLFDNDPEYDEPSFDNFNVFRALIKRRFKVVSIALTREQITQYNPPPNPAKKTDPRAKDFIKKHGSQSWEVDALRPEVLNTILTDAIESRIDLSKYEVILEEEKSDKRKLVTLKKKLENEEIEEDEDHDLDESEDSDDE